MKQNKETSDAHQEPETQEQQEKATDSAKQDDNVDKALFTKGGIDSATLSKTLSSKKAMKREYVPKTIIQFLRERKSFHENHAQLQKHMSEAHKLLSPHGFIRTANPVANCPELVLDPEAKQTEGASSPSSSSQPFIIAVRSGQADRRGRELRQNLSGQPVRKGVQTHRQNRIGSQGGRAIVNPEKLHQAYHHRKP